MEPNEVMENEEVIETATEEIVKAIAGCGFKVAASFGLGILAGMAICKLAKPVMAKIKARKATATSDMTADKADDDGSDDEKEETEEETEK